MASVRTLRGVRVRAVRLPALDAGSAGVAAEQAAGVLMEMTQRAAAERAFALAEQADEDVHRVAAPCRPPAARLVELSGMWAAVAAQFGFVDSAPATVEIAVDPVDGNCLACGEPVYRTQGRLIHIGGYIRCAAMKEEEGNA